MISLWVAGGSCYEITGVMHLLKDSLIATRPFRPGSLPGYDDVLLLCFSGCSDQEILATVLQ